MGTPDSYGDKHIQLKCRNAGSACCDHFSIGDRVPLDDGIYLATDGLIVVKDGVFIMGEQDIQDKYGNFISVSDIWEKL